MTDVLFPSLHESDPETEGVLATWFVADGDTVAAGQLLGEVQVDRSTQRSPPRPPARSSCWSPRTRPSGREPPSRGSPEHRDAAGGFTRSHPPGRAPQMSS
ncbi:hypothetical protein KTU01_13040 [Kocuria turfanensis]|uniref:Lipoyl-binding domain-containing protein n=1 Tax=Kocuria turfanensis TaxID=388357 RepID=A0A512IBW3_9MICC|nr:hypothetical protein KTU01_13040 [Kocuria turfanensis]